MVTPKMLGHVRPDYLFNYSSKPGRVYPGTDANFFCIHDGYAYEFFTAANKIIAIYKVITDEDDYIIDFEFVKIISIGNINKSYRWVVIDGYAIAFTVSGSSTSAPNSSNNSYRVSASATSNLQLSLFKLNGTSVIESYINHGTIASASSSANAPDAITDASDKRIDLKFMIYDDVNVRIAVYAYAKASGTYTYNGSTSSCNGSASSTSAIVHFNIRDIISAIESGGDASALVVKESGTGNLYMTGLNDYVMYSRQIQDGTTSAKNGLWKYTINDDNSCTIDTSAVTTAPTNIPTVFTLNGYQFGEYDQMSGRYLYTDSNTNAVNQVPWYVVWLGRSDKSYSNVVGFKGGQVALSKNIPTMDSIGDYFLNYDGKRYAQTLAYDIVNNTNLISTIAERTMDQISTIMYASKIDTSIDSICYYIEYKRLPLLKLAGGHIVTYNGRWYCIGMQHTTNGFISNSAIAGDTVNDLYGKLIFTTIEYDEDTDEFYNVFRSRKPAVSADNSIVEITRMDYILNTSEFSISTPIIYILDADEDDRVSIVTYREVFTSKTAYTSETYINAYGTIDFSSHPLIINPGHKLYICYGTPDAPAVYHIYPEFTIYGCKLTNS